jgi:hypothetical protein
VISIVQSFHHLPSEQVLVEERKIGVYVLEIVVDELAK